MNRQSEYLKSGKGTAITSRGQIVEYEPRIIPYSEGNLVARKYKAKGKEVKGAAIFALGLGAAMEISIDGKLVGDGWDKAPQELAGRGLEVYIFNPPDSGLEASMISDGRFSINNELKALKAMYNHDELARFKNNKYHVDIAASGSSKGGYVISVSAMKGTKYCAVSIFNPVEHFMDIESIKDYLKAYKLIMYLPGLREIYARLINTGANLMPFETKGKEYLDKIKEEGWSKLLPNLKDISSRFYYLKSEKFHLVLEELVKARPLHELVQEHDKKQIETPLLVYYCIKDGDLFSFLDDEKKKDLQEKWNSIASNHKFITIETDDIHAFGDGTGKVLTSEEFTKRINESADFFLDHMH